jgi:hypothetical protein
MKLMIIGATRRRHRPYLRPSACICLHLRLNSSLFPPHQTRPPIPPSHPPANYRAAKFDADPTHPHHRADRKWQWSLPENIP